MKLTNIKASLYRYLYEQLEVPHSIKLFEATNLSDFSSCSQWLVIDPLSNRLGPQPVQLYFLHASVQKGGSDESLHLARLLDTVLSVVDQGTRIDVYDYDSGLVVGEMEISEISMSPEMQHASGGSFVSITIGVAYACN